MALLTAKKRLTEFTFCFESAIETVTRRLSEAAGLFRTPAHDHPVRILHGISFRVVYRLEKGRVVMGSVIVDEKACVGGREWGKRLCHLGVERLRGVC